jgi:predicted PurR-regulated permease PerM
MDMTTMNKPPESNFELEVRAPPRLLDVLIRAGLIGGLAVLCYRVFSPFLTLMAWSTILAVTLYPLHKLIARSVHGKQWLASTILALVGVLLIITPTALLMNSFADTVRNLIAGVQQDTLRIPPPKEAIGKLPIIGEKVYDIWLKASTDLPGFVQGLQPKVGELARTGLGVVASVGSGLLLFLGSFILGSIIMAYGESGAVTTRAIFGRVAGPERGEALAKLCTATIRTVALGVIGVAFAQAIVIGLALLLARVPAAGVLSIITFVLGVAQVPALVVTIPVIAYIWLSGDYGSSSAITYTIILLLAGLTDNVLKPMMLGRGVNVPMPVILFGALGGMASAGIMGMFVGATALALGYNIFMHWVSANPEADRAPLPENDPVKTAKAQPKT